MRSIRAIGVLILGVPPAIGHEYWFEQDNFFLKLRETTALHRLVGWALKKDEERAYQASKTNSFQMFSSRGRIDMRTMAEDDRSPIVNFSADRAETAERRIGRTFGLH